jgi:hypothetical protein
MQSFNTALEETLRTEFFPFINTDLIQEKLETNGYLISSVSKDKGAIVFKAKNPTAVIDTLLFGINPVSKKMSIFGIISPHGKAVFLFRTILVSDLPDVISTPYLNAVSKLSNNSGFYYQFGEFIKRSNQSHTQLADGNLFKNISYSEDPLLFNIMSNFKALSSWTNTRQNFYLESSLLSFLQNMHSSKLPFISELTPQKRIKLKREVTEQILFSFLKTKLYPLKRLIQLVAKGKSYLGLNIYPFMLEKVKYNETEFNVFFDEIKESLFTNMMNSLVTDFQTLYLDTTPEGSTVGKLKTLHRKVFGKSPSYISIQEKFYDFKEASFQLHLVLSYLELHPEIINSFFGTNEELIPIISNLNFNPLERRSGRIIPLSVDVTVYNDLRTLYGVVEAKEAMTNRGGRGIFVLGEVPF